MIYKKLVLCALICVITGCKQDLHLIKIEGKRIEINDSISSNKAIDELIKPYRTHVNNNLDSVLAYSVGTYSKTDGLLNTAIGNFMADVVFEQSNPVFKSRTGKDIDMVLLNHGGIRGIISKGNITSRTGYKLMPFENSVVVVELKGQVIKDMIKYLQEKRRAHPISKLNILLDANYELVEAKINNKDVVDDQTYYVATSDYLYNGGDNSKYHSLTLSGTIDDEGSGKGAVVFLISGIQNGSPEGIALSKSDNTSVQFLSYEGTITAIDGDANGLLSVDIGINESSSTLTGYALEYDEDSTSWVTVTNDSPGDFAQGEFLSSSLPQIGGFKLYPVPTSNGIIHVTSSLNIAMNISVYDLSGKELINKTIDTKYLNVSMLNSGIYIITVSHNQASTTKKLIIQ